MITSPFSALRRLASSLRSHALDDRDLAALLLWATLGTAAMAIALVAIDPTPLGFGSVHLMQVAASTQEREAILAAWAQLELLPRAKSFLLLEAVLLAPLLWLAFRALAERLYRLVERDVANASEGPDAACVRHAFCIAILAALLLTLVGNALALALLSNVIQSGAWWASARVFGIAELAAWTLVAAAAALWFAWWYFAAGATAARMRAEVADILWRSKFATLILLVYGALVLGMDQTRDALLRQTSDPMHGAWGIALTALAVWALAYASWLWPRLVLRLATPGRQESPKASAFAKWWCRILGLLPFGFVAMVLAVTLRDQPRHSPALPWLWGFLLLDGLLALLFLASVAWRRGDESIGYYNVAADAQSARADMGSKPWWVAWAPPVLFLLARLASLMEWTPPLALAVITSGLAAWGGIFGWVAWQSRRRAVPYLLGAILAYALLGIFGLDEVHQIRVGVDPAGHSDFAPTVQFLWTLALALPCIVLACWLYRRDAPPRKVAGAGLLTLAVLAGLLKLHDGPPLAHQLPLRPSLEQATMGWLEDLAANPPPGAAPFPVYLVSAEGGGIRSAYWTASVLARMKALDPAFDQRTFSLSAVSGGALGVAVFRACELEAAARPSDVSACIDRFGATDLWTQLLGGALFEDALASVLPTALFCSSPGCGLLGRSYWFEGTMETSVGRMASGLSAATARGVRQPHLFLTVTRVESGERWIQSDLAIDWHSFPAACDVLKMLGSDIRLSTAAHNSSRFPYTNPVGALYGGPCLDGQTAEAPGTRLRARLQDGGYFDDSATATSTDILRMVAHCLFGGCTTSASAASLEALRQRLRPVIVVIRNEDRFDIRTAPDTDGVCNPAEKRDPARPRDDPPLRLVPSVLSSAVTLYQTRSAHMRASEAQLAADADALWERLGLKAKTTPLPCGPFVDWVDDAPVRRVDLLVDAVYPSGWVLSTSAMKGIRDQAEARLPR